ncbi:uncharacterized protein BKCO1_36000106 [Diplodia corticola]|uniref:Uncharacterized protein n=1 Tax=Diplodia corticola TaxID=236234 RepID=A0A1J9RYC2_9PEZI|nr:uncharacterized protein BKCO1_36000106 [Diplodia corticola]OJD32812.1 hypothetical protein BKCO1_36000106 [Diplodia corticola]
MASYHRVLSVFDRSVKDKNLECNCDIHSWEIQINGQRWFGKIRLIGFVDVFFLICYSTHDRFEHGIIIYKEDDVIRDTLIRAEVDPRWPQLELDYVNKKEVEKNPEAPRKYFSFEDNPSKLDYVITSLGHEVDLRTDYASSELKKYKIELRRTSNPHMHGPIRRGITQHSVLELVHDAMRYGIISNGEMTAEFLGRIMGGSHAEDTMRKWATAFSGGGGN